MSDYAPNDDRPLAGYGALMATYSAAVVAASALVRRRRALPERIDARDLALVSVATHKLSRLVTKDSVASPVRAPFTRYKEPAGVGEVNEDVRGTGLQHAIGELVTCPFCLDVWIATAFAFGLALAPRATRFVASALVMVTASDFLHLAYASAQHHAEG